jgi:hypothetical protein
MPWLFGLLALLTACGKSDPQVLVDPVVKVMPAELVVDRVNAKLKQQTSPTKSSEPPVPLDLSLPAAESKDVEGWQGEQQGRYGVKAWFAKKQGEEDRLKMKTKVILKADATMEKAMNDYAESVDGAEVGFEYKMQ